MRYPFRLLLYAAVIAAAPTLPKPWMVALQAGLGGVMLGIRFEQWTRESRKKWLRDYERNHSWTHKP